MIAVLDYLNTRIGIISLLVGIVLIILSLVMYKFPPKKINIFYGYRTAASMKSQQAWDFAQKNSTAKMFQLGVVMLAVSSLNLFVDISQGFATILGMAVMVLGIGFMIFQTEKAIKRNFPNE